MNPGFSTKPTAEPGFRGSGFPGGETGPPVSTPIVGILDAFSQGAVGAQGEAATRAVTGSGTSSLFPGPPLSKLCVPTASVTSLPAILDRAERPGTPLIGARRASSASRPVTGGGKAAMCRPQGKPVRRSRSFCGLGTEGRWPTEAISCRLGQSGPERWHFGKATGHRIASNPKFCSEKG